MKNKTITQVELIEKLNIQLQDVNTSMEESLKNKDFKSYERMLLSMDRLVELITKLNKDNEATVSQNAMATCSPSEIGRIVHDEILKQFQTICEQNRRNPMSI